MSSKLYYPLKYEPRDIQKNGLDFIKKSVRNGKRFIMLNLPTGVGKSFLSIMFMNWYKHHINNDAKFDILTNSKILQDQYTREFNFISDLRGKSNYICRKHSCTCQEGKELNKTFKTQCTNCEYDRAFVSWRMSDVSITNFHLFDSISVFIPKVLEEKNPNVLIVDEAHDFESVFGGFISMKVSSRSMKMMGFSDIEIKENELTLSTINNSDDLIDFIKEVYLKQLEIKINELKDLIKNPKIGNKEKLKTSKQISIIKNNIPNFEKLIEDYNENKNNWVMDIDFNEKNKKFSGREFTLQPVWSFNYLNKYVWSKYDHIIFMSGTILDKDMFAYLNGLDVDLCSYLESKSPFPVKNRPIYYIKTGKMTYDKKEETWLKQVEIIKKILKRNEKNKGIIHTYNYEISNWFKEEFGKDKRFIFHETDDRDEALLRHIDSDEPTVIVSPSMMTGVDLKDDLSRFQIILKMPFPNLTSNKIKIRMKENKEWYSWKTVVDIIQSVGRSVRSEEDYAETYILDESFSNILKFNHKYLPEYFTECIRVIK